MFTHDEKLYYYDTTTRTLVANDQNLMLLPITVAKRCKDALVVDFSHNRLVSLENFDMFTCAHTLLLDDNRLKSAGLAAVCEEMPCVTTLSLNKNPLDDGDTFFETLELKFKKLTHLSAWFTPLFDEMSRHDVIKRLSKLLFLGSSAITEDDKKPVLPKTISMATILESQKKQLELLPLKRRSSSAHVQESLDVLIRTKPTETDIYNGRLELRNNDKLGWAWYYCVLTDAGRLKRYATVEKTRLLGETPIRLDSLRESRKKRCFVVLHFKEKLTFRAPAETWAVWIDKIKTFT